MPNYQDILTEIQEILNMLNPGELPDTQMFLSSLFSGEQEPLSPYRIACGVVDSLKTEDYPDFLFDFLVKLYGLAIQSADGETSDAMNDLGAMYYDGRGCEQDYAKALYWYDQAAHHGNRQAQENLGYCYYYGRSVPVDYKKAFHYFALGAFDGHLVSLYKIGDMYQKGLYVEKNEEEAFRIYEHCMQCMTDEDAPHAAGPVFLRLGNAFLHGSGTEQNPDTALVCFQKAEGFLRSMVRNGEFMYRSSMEEAIAGQDKARAAMDTEQ